MRHRLYILEGKEPVPVNAATFEAWMEQFESMAPRRVSTTTVGAVVVSTLFLGVDQASGDGPPLLFETVVYRGDDLLQCQRYSTWAEAEMGHVRMVHLYAFPFL